MLTLTETHEAIVTAARKAVAEFEAESTPERRGARRSGDWWAGHFSAHIDSLLHVIDVASGSAS